MKTQSIFAVALLASAGIVFGPARICAQAPAGAGASQSSDPHALPSNPTPQDKTQGQRRYTYERPSEETKQRNYLFDAFGPYPIAGSIIVAGINQANNTPPEWGGGAKAFGQRVVSNYGINAISTTTRYGLSELLHQDTLYYRCQCKGFFPRLSHALVSTLTARRGEDGALRFFRAGAGCALRRHHGGDSHLVPGPLQFLGRFPHGQLQFTGAGGRQRGHRISVPRTAQLPFAHSYE